MAKRISPAIFGIALFCFLLPWVDVSCQGVKVASFTGVQLVKGTTIEEAAPFGAKQQRKVKGEELALFALLSTVVGLILSLSHKMQDKKMTLALVFVCGLGTAMLFLLRSKLQNDVFREGQGMLRLEFGVGYYLVMLSYLSVIGISVYQMMEEKGKLSFQPLIKASHYKICTQCGSKNPSDSGFCSECGSKFE